MTDHVFYGAREKRETEGLSVPATAEEPCSPNTSRGEWMEGTAFRAPAVYTGIEAGIMDSGGVLGGRPAAHWLERTLRLADGL
ncbi:hypothetical protein D3C78_1560450 [compost metagenome]